MASLRVLGPDEEPPGRWVPHPATRGTVWEGESHWETHHGEAAVECLLGKPFRIRGALTPDGRMDIERAAPSDALRWRRRSPSFPRGWVHGRIEITPADVVFSDLPHEPFVVPVPPADGEPPCLAYDMATDGAFLARLQDDGFAHAVYESMRNVEFRKEGSDRTWFIAWGRGGEQVARMRSLGEHYCDFHLAGMRLSDGRFANEEERHALLRDVARHYARLGWRALGADERAALHGQALSSILEAESRPPGECPDWAERYPARVPVSPIDRTVMAARTGRMTRSEFDQAMERIDVEAGDEAWTSGMAPQ